MSRDSACWDSSGSWHRWRKSVVRLYVLSLSFSIYIRLFLSLSLPFSLYLFSLYVRFFLFLRSPLSFSLYIRLFLSLSTFVSFFLSLHSPLSFFLYIRLFLSLSLSVSHSPFLSLFILCLSSPLHPSRPLSLSLSLYFSLSLSRSSLSYHFPLPLSSFHPYSHPPVVYHGPPITCLVIVLFPSHLPPTLQGRLLTKIAV